MDIHVGDVLELKKEHPCGSRFPGITGESEAMLRLKASILTAGGGWCCGWEWTSSCAARAAATS